jgi:hypothetical protein
LEEPRDGVRKEIGLAQPVLFSKGFALLTANSQTKCNSLMVEDKMHLQRGFSVPPLPTAGNGEAFLGIGERLSSELA